MSLRCWQFGFPQASLGTIQSMFNFPNWLFEEIYLLVFVLQTIFVLNFAQNKGGGSGMLISFSIFFLRKTIFCNEKKQTPRASGGRTRTARRTRPTQARWEGAPLGAPAPQAPCDLLWLSLDRTSPWSCFLSCCPGSCEVLGFAQLPPCARRSATPWACPRAPLVLQAQVPSFTAHLIQENAAP